MRSHLTESRSQETTADRRAPTGSRFRPLLVIATSLALVALFVTIAVVHQDAGGCRSPRRSAGIDVSSFQGVINWSEVARTCIGFAYLRVAAGRTVDPTYGPTHDSSGGIAVIGELGAGKSVILKNVAAVVRLMLDGRVIVIDRTRSREWAPVAVALPC